MLKSFENKISTVKEQIEYTKKQLVDVKEELDKPFTSADRIKELQKEKARIDSELDLDNQENTRSVEDDFTEKMERYKVLIFFTKKLLQNSLFLSDK